jgi:hypothetical protein
MLASLLPQICDLHLFCMHAESISHHKQLTVFLLESILFIRAGTQPFDSSLLLIPRIDLQLVDGPVIAAA